MHKHIHPCRGWMCLCIAMLFLLTSLLTACSNTPSGLVVSSPLLGRYAITPFPTNGVRGTLTFADSQFPDSVNPLFAGAPVDFEVETALWARPVFYDQQFHAHPDQLMEVPLPENGDVQDGGKTVIMRLRHDLRWSDGQPVLASDFLYWWQLNQNPATGAITTSGYDQIASIDTPDNYTVVLHMKQPFGPYLWYLPYAAPQHAWGHLNPTDLQNTPSVFQAPAVTNGPYALAKFVNGQSYVMTPNRYYRSTTFHGPYLAQLVYRAYNDVNALSAAALQQQIDVGQGYQEYQLPLLSQHSASVRVLITPAAAYEHLDFNLMNPLLQDVRVRQAIQMALDKCALLKDALNSLNILNTQHDGNAQTCDRVVNQVEPPPSLVQDAAIPASVYNPNEARTLLKQAGWTPDTHGLLMRNGQSLIMRLVTTADNPLRAAIAQEVQQDLRAIGILVRIATFSLSDFFAVYTRGGVLATGNYDLSLFSYANAPEPDDEYAVFASSQIPSVSNPYASNYGRVRDPIIDRALTTARTTIVFADRVAAYHQFLARLASQVYTIPLFTDVNILVFSNRVQNIIPNPEQFDNNWNISDWWVQG